jgi:hypothetical protein
MCPGAAPVWEQALIGVFGPPVLSILWRFRARGWARIVQGSSVSDRTKRRQKSEFWILLAGSYVMMIGIFVYAAWKCRA